MLVFLIEQALNEAIAEAERRGTASGTARFRSQLGCPRSQTRMDGRTRGVILSESEDRNIYGIWWLPSCDEIGQTPGDGNEDYSDCSSGDRRAGWPSASGTKARD